MNKSLFCSLALFTAFIPLNIAAAETVNMTNPTGPVIDLSVRETIKVKPDMVTLYFTISAQDKDKNKAILAADQKLGQAIAAAKSAGIMEEDIVSDQKNISPDYDYDTTPYKVKGYSAHRNLNIIIKDIADIEKVNNIANNIIKSGASSLNYTEFDLLNKEPYLQKATETALLNAKKRANWHAKFAGYSGVKLLNVKENIESEAMATRDTVEMAYEAAVEAVAPEPANFMPSDIEITAALVLAYEMTP
ncbi:hypothetical protein LPB140_06590 [Sphingorhabdus lutea]|uniref:DUF541 domain-containing protein n=1 Tax=Sphingorhabdus lutea TaxID=1913578 RepID=A0A1L3JBN3_9SPHN|nr:SIMPL domain-containing protein [Sphingorhabdus lutea]APG62509.1 hypothetical protein LPB140_06590 [Sphingorhabdus lutea]